MMNSDPVLDDADFDAIRSQDAAVDAIMRSGAIGALTLAGLAVAVVVALWFAFYILVFVPRVGAP
jgi:hypothetical protein